MFPTAYEDHLLPGRTPLVVTNDDTLAAAAKTRDDPYFKDAMSLFTDPEVARACRATQLIETPDYTNRDDSHLGGRLRNQAENVGRLQYCCKLCRR